MKGTEKALSQIEKDIYPLRKKHRRPSFYLDNATRKAIFAHSLPPESRGKLILLVDNRGQKSTLVKSRTGLSWQIFNKGVTTIKWQKSSNKWCWGNWICTCKRMKLDALLPHTEINLKCTIDLIIRGKIVKLVRESTAVNHCDLGLCNSFLDGKPEA